MIQGDEYPKILPGSAQPGLFCQAGHFSLPVYTKMRRAISMARSGYEPTKMLLRRVGKRQLFFLFESCLEGG